MNAHRFARFSKWCSRGRVPTAISVAVMSATGVAPALAEEAPRYDYGPHMWGGGWGMFFGPIWMLLFLAILVALVVLLVRWLSGSSAGGLNVAATKAPLDILRERFARGEIDEEEFDKRKKVLGA